MIARLARLLLLKQRATLRHYVKSLRSPRRALSLLVMVTLVGIFLVASWFNAEGNLGRDSLAVLCAGIFVMGVAGGFVQQGPRFTPADVDFLFPAPFSPRHLLIWRLLHLLPVTLISVLFLFAIFGARLERPWRFLAGMFLLQTTMLHVQLFIAVMLTLASDAIARRLRGGGKTIAMIALFGALLYMVSAISREGGIGQIVVLIATSPLARIVFFPAAACVDFVYAEQPGTAAFALLWLILGAFGTGALLLLPDIDFREDSVATTARVAKLLAARRRTGTVIEIEEGRRVKSGAVPAARVLFRGSGAIVWKNLLLLVRSWKSVLPSLFIGLVIVLPVVFMSKSGYVREGTGFLALPLIMATLFWSNALGFDLRREIDRLDQLRALPLRPAAVVFAELLLPWALGVTLQEILIAVLSFTNPDDRTGLGALALALPLLSFLAVVIDNLALFVFAPRSPAGAARGTFSMNSPAQILRLFAWLIAIAPGFVAGVLVHEATDSLPWSIAAGVVVEVALTIALFFHLVQLYQSREVEVGD